MTTKSEANKALAELYEEHTGLTSGPVIKALNEMNNELGVILDPYCRPYKNLSEHYIDDIPPGGYGVRPNRGGGKYLKPVKIIKNKKETNADG